MTPTRVLYLAPGAHRHGGAERVLTGLLGALDPARVKPRLLMFAEGDLADYVRHYDFESSTIPIGNGFRPTARYQGRLGLARSGLLAMPWVMTAVRSIRREARSFGADVIHSNGTRAHILLPFLGTPSRSTVATLHDLPQQALEAKLMSVALKRADTVIANSPLVARTFESMGIPSLTIDNPVETPRPREQASARRHLGIPEKAFVVASLAHFHWYKGQLDLVTAIAGLDEHFHLIVAGGPLYGQPSHDYLREVRNTAAASDAASRIHFVGLQDDVSWIYGAADAVAHCSVRPEPFGMAVIEAMLSGTPVVASSCGTPGEMLEHAKTALLYAPGNVGSLMEGLRALRDDPGLARQIAKAGRSWATGRFDPHRHAAEVTEVYEELRARTRPAIDRA